MLRRLRSLAALDPELEQGVRARGARRRAGLELLAGRLADATTTRPDALREAVAVLQVLTSFKTFDALAGPDRSPKTSPTRCTGSPSPPSGSPAESGACPCVRPH